MTPAARLALAIEVLDQILVSISSQGAAADTLLGRAFAVRRYAGSKDRAAVRDLVYSWLRNLESLRWLSGSESNARRLALAWAKTIQPEALLLFGQSTYGPAALSDDERASTPNDIAAAPPHVQHNIPAWLWTRLAAAYPTEIDVLCDGLNARAPLDVVVNVARTDRTAMLDEFGAGALMALSPLGLRLAPGTLVEQSPAFRSGLIEPQDEGSQLASLLVAPQPGETVLDLCAGAGGKTLALAALSQGKARIWAYDQDARRLQRARPRLDRWAVGGVTMLDDLPSEKVDAVLIDAPCSGTGTWRRNPEARFRLTPEHLAHLVTVQRDLLAAATALLKPGGRLIYAICSVLPEEGVDQLAFAADLGLAPWAIPRIRGALTPKPNCVVLTPHRTGTDGFTLAQFQRIG